MNITSNLRIIALTSNQLANTKSELGQLAYTSDTMKAYVAMGGNGVWTELCNYSEALEKEAIHCNKPKICSQCGAPLKRYSHKCEYCDTEY